MKTTTKPFSKCAGSTVYFALNEPTRIVIEVFNTLGKKLAEPLNGIVTAGTFRISPVSGFNHQTLVVRVRRGNDVQVFCIQNVNSSRGTTTGFDGFARTSTSLSKTTTAVDTLIVSCRGFVSQKLPISLYTPPDSMDIVLHAINYQLTVNAGTGGTITVPTSSSVTVNYGVATTIMALSGTHYRFLNWTLTSGMATIDNTASDSTTVILSSGNATVTANFARTYQLTLVAGLHGKIDGPTSRTINNCDTVITISASPTFGGYIFYRWSVTSGAAHIANTGSSTTTMNIFCDSPADATIQADFQQGQ